MELSPAHYVDEPEALERLVETLRQEPLIGVDTEADSFHHHREKVCLIQVSVPGADYLVDPLRLPSLEPLRTILESIDHIKVFHDAGYDIIGLRRDFGIVAHGIFDTMLASRMLGWQRFGLAAVLEECFGFTLDKRLQRSDWARRPLSPEQLAYARFDTHFLPKLYQQLRQALIQAGRLGWHTEDCARMPVWVNRMPIRQPLDPDAWWRIKGVRRLSASEKGRAKALYHLREALADKLDRPAFKVFSDAVILELAQTPPDGDIGLEPRRGLRRPGVERFGGKIVKALATAEPVHQRAPAGTGRRRRAGQFLDPATRDRYEALREYRRSRAAELGVDPEVLLGNATLEELALRGQVNADQIYKVEPLDGWRGSVVGEGLAAVLDAHENSRS